MADDTHEGWSNRETWAVAYHINDDQSWQQSVREALREGDFGYSTDGPFTLAEAREAYFNSPGTIALRAGEIIKDNVEEALTPDEVDVPWGTEVRPTSAQWLALQDIGSLWRVSWTELGASFLRTLAEQDA